MNWKKLLSPARQRMSSSVKPSSDLRSEFERDYHRIIVSASFRRLADKTQVFPLDQSDFIRTRLTHSLEVSSVARSLGQNIGQFIIHEQKDPDFDLQSQSDICSILQCAGLIHDIGNPPFGHFGETTIRDWFCTHLSSKTLKGIPLTQLLSPEMLQDLYYFEGNAQALRLTTKLHFLVDEHGMNLTAALLAAIIKYPIPAAAVDPKSGDIRTKKPGYFQADKEIFDFIQKETGTNGCRHPLCFLLEAADDISYLTADIEDGYKKGFITYNRLLRELLHPSVTEQISEQERDSYFSAIQKLRDKYELALKLDVPDPEEYAVSNWIVFMQSFLIQCATEGFIKNYDSIMEGTYKKDLFDHTKGETLHYILGAVAYKLVFTTQSIYKTEISAATVLDYLMDKFLSAAILFDTEERLTDVQEKLILLISDNYKQVYFRESEGKNETEKLYLRIMLVTDYICGMTDSYAKRLYQEMNGLSL